MSTTSRSVVVNANQQARRRARSPIAELRPRRIKQLPPEHTSAENFYYVKQMNTKTPMVIVMSDGETIRGCIEWYDRSCLKVNRDDGPNVVIQKHWIKYMFKEGADGE